jgi:type III secretion system YscI/HrpB-like protein
MAPIAVASERVAAPGDLILRGLERLRGEYRAVGVELDTLSNRAEINPMDLLNLQMQVAQVTLGSQLIGQVASKLEQNLNTLLKSQ